MKNQKLLIMLGITFILPLTTNKLVQADFDEDSLKQEAQEEMELEISQDYVADSHVKEIKASDYQLGKTMIDAFGKRVRLEEYLFKSSPNEYKFLVLNYRDNRLDYYYDLWKFKNPLGDDFNVKEFLWNCKNIFFNQSVNKPSNWLTEWDTQASNTIDNYQRLTLYGEPIQITSKEYKYNDDKGKWEPTGNQISYWTPSSITGKVRIYATDGNYDKVKVYWKVNVEVSNGQPSWTYEEKCPGPNLANSNSYTENNLTTAYKWDGTKFTSNPSVKPERTFGPEFNLSQEPPPPSTPLHFWFKTTYKDNTWMQEDFHVINNEGKHYTVGDVNPFKEGKENFDDLNNVNFEVVVQAKEFNDRKIDIVISPSIFFASEESDAAAQNTCQGQGGNSCIF